MKSYWRFAAMILTSTVIMFAAMYLKKLASEIIEAQRREIAEMKSLIHDLEE